MKKTLIILGILFLLLFECLRVYLIMPMPGSQNFNSIDFAYFLGANKLIIRLVGYLMVMVLFVLIYKILTKKDKLILG
jgi:hypothetical protein